MSFCKSGAIYGSLKVHNFSLDNFWQFLLLEKQILQKIDNHTVPQYFIEYIKIRIGKNIALTEVSSL